MDYDSMVDLFVRSGLEIDSKEPAPEGLVTCFELLDESGIRQAAGGLCFDKGEYILRCVAVEEKQRQLSGSLRKCPGSTGNLVFRLCRERKLRL